MKEEKEDSFFKKLIISIKDFEKYPELASKKWSLVLSYFVKLLVIFVLIISFTSVYKVAEELQQAIQYIKEEIPEFTFSNGILQVEQSSAIIEQNNDNFFDTIIIDTNQTEENNVEKDKEVLEKAQNGILLLQDRLLIKTQVATQIVEYPYNTLEETYGISEFNKQQVLEYFSGTNMFLMYIGIFLMLALYLFVLYFISIWLDIILLGAFGFFTALIMRLHLRFSAMCKIAIHSLTLPILLNALVTIIETFTTLRIQYFQIMYIAIAYIYIITAILMIKSDVIKSQKELAKILQEQEKVREELERQKEKEEEEKQEKRKKKKKVWDKNHKEKMHKERK